MTAERRFSVVNALNNDSPPALPFGMFSTFQIDAAGGFEKVF